MENNILDILNHVVLPPLVGKEVMAPGCKKGIITKFILEYSASKGLIIEVLVRPQGGIFKSNKLMYTDQGGHQFGYLPIPLDSLIMKSLVDRCLSGVNPISFRKIVKTN